MRRRGSAVLIALLGSALACGGGDAAGPSQPGNVIDGVAYTATVEEVVHFATTVKQVTIRVTLTNTTAATVTRSYPAGCPVRMRFYRMTDDKLVYDESQFPCGTTNTVSVTIGPKQSATVASGTRNPWEIAGDSLPVPATYYAGAIVRIVGMNPIELDAGTYRLPRCVEVFPPMGMPYTECTY